MARSTHDALPKRWRTDAPSEVPSYGMPPCPAAPNEEHAAWWLLRLAPAPYYLLGDSVAAPLRIRIDTPWDWRQRWEFLGLEISPALDAGQPQVDWTIRALDRTNGEGAGR